MSNVAGPLKELNKRVTAAIFRAEHVVDDPAEAVAFWRQVSALEEQIAALVPARQTEGVIARLGAVTAALDVGDRLRAIRLASSYMIDAPPDLADELRGLLTEARAIDALAAQLASTEIGQAVRAGTE